MIEVKQWDVICSVVYGELTEEQRAHLDSFTYNAATHAAAALRLPLLAALAAFAAVLSSGLF